MTGQGSVAVVTGAGSAIGRAVSIALFNAGYEVVLAGRAEDDLSATLEGFEVRGLAVRTDVTHEDQVRDLIRRARDGRPNLEWGSRSPGRCPVLSYCGYAFAGSG